MDKLTVRLFGVILFFLAAYVRPVSAHDGLLHDAPVGAQWSFDPLVLLSAGLAGWVYLRGWNTLARRGHAAHPARWQRLSFLAGLVTIVLALVSPLDAMAGQLFSAHMVQHTLLMLVAPPLLVLGQPFPALLLGLPRRLQLGMGQLWRTLPGLRVLWQAASQPLVVWLLHAAVLWGWHAPRYYSAAVENDLIHAVQHLSFTGTALLFWWVVIHTYGENPARRGTGFMYLFVTALQSGLLGALITFSPGVWNQVYVGRAEQWGLSALADQQMAGTIMWVPAGLVFLIAALSLLKPWIDSIPSAEGTVPQKELE